jgi:hypothetical protein
MSQTDTITDQPPVTPEQAEVVAPLFALQTMQEFRDEFVAAAGQSDTTGVLLDVMQFEVNDQTQPIFDAMTAAQQAGVADVRFRYDRVARQHIRAGEGEAISSAYVFLGRTMLHGGLKDKPAVKEANAQREGLITELELAGITNAHNKTRKRAGHRSHSHVKMAIITKENPDDDEAWILTGNLRGIDFEISNIALKFTDPELVSAAKEIFEQGEAAEVGDDKIYPVYDQEGQLETKLILDEGAKGRSVIAQQALDMASSLEPGDQFMFIGQWPPVEGRLGRAVYGDLIETLSAKTRAGSLGTYLMSPEEDLHPTKRGSRYLQRKAKEMEALDPNMSAINLARQTHIKGFVIIRANGDREVLTGSHNLTSWTVKNGTREVAVWTKDSQTIDQFLECMEQLRGEQ